MSNVEYILNFAKISLSEDKLIIFQLNLGIFENNNKMRRDGIKFFVRQLRNWMKDDVIIFFQNKIYLFPGKIKERIQEINQKIEDKLDFVVQSVSLGFSETFSLTEISTYDDDKLRLFKIVIGEIIATKLRKLQYMVNTISSRSSTIDAFRASLIEEIKTIGDVETYSGIEYRIFIIKNDIFIVLDPRTSLIHAMNLRDLFNNPIMRGKILNSYKCKFIDTCGLSLDECEHRWASYSLCELGGKGQIVTIDNFDPERSPEPKIINYLDPIVRCYTGRLKKRIKQEPPIGIRIEGEKEYSYPLERLRKIVDLSEGSYKRKGISREITNKVQPPNHERLAKTKFFLEDIKICNIKNLNNEGVDGFLSTANLMTYSKDDIRVNEFPVEHRIILKEGQQSRTIVHGLSRIRPYERKSGFKFKTINLLCYGFPNDALQKFKTFFSESQSDGRKSIHQLFNTRFIISSIDIDSLYTFMHTADEIGVAILFIKEEEDHQSINELRKDLYSKGIPSQRITEDALYSLNYSKLINLLLGVYGKAGGHPWVGYNAQKRNRKIFVGIANSFIGKSGLPQYTILKISVFHSNGELIKLYWEKIERRSTSVRLKEVINEISAEFKDYEIIIHRSGAILERREFEALNNLYNEQIISSVVEIIDQNTLFRIYGQGFNEIEEKPEIFPTSKGLYIQLDKRTFILRSTEETPEKFQTETTIQVRIKFGKEERYISLIQDILALSMCYTGATTYSTKLPVTLHNLGKLSNDPPEDLSLLPRYSNFLL